MKDKDTSFLCIFEGQKNQMKKYLSLLLLLLFHLNGVKALTYKPLGDEAQLSILTCSAGDQVWSLYGHSAIRVQDPENRRDLTFNYGLFSFDAPHFIWRFCTGQTDYLLGATTTARFVQEYAEQNRRVTEQVLDLSPAERENIWKALYVNQLPENRSYRYNFFYDNCATRPRLMVEKHIEGTLAYDSTVWYPTMRQAVAFYNRDCPWTWLGISMLLGSTADRPGSFTDELFAPELLMDALSRATVDGRPLIRETNILTDIDPELSSKRGWPVPSPTPIMWLVFLTVLLLGWRELKQRRHNTALDTVLFILAGLAGIVLAFLAFFSVHPDVSPNYLLFAFHPLWLLFLIAECVPAFRRSQASLYIRILFSVMLLTAIGGYLIGPQYQHPALLPLMLALLSRCLSGIISESRASHNKQPESASF